MNEAEVNSLKVLCLQAEKLCEVNQKVTNMIKGTGFSDEVDKIMQHKFGLQAELEKNIKLKHDLFTKDGDFLIVTHDLIKIR